MQDVRAVLDPEEPDYELAKALGPQALPHLVDLVQGDSPMLALKAVYAAGMIGGDVAEHVLSLAAGSEDPRLRVVAAAAMRNVARDLAEPRIAPLLTDSDAGVRATAVRSVPREMGPDLRAAVERIARSDPDPGNRELARGVLGRGRKPPPRYP